MQISNNKLHRMIVWPTIAASMIILILLAIFIYFDVYDVIRQSEEVANLKMNISEQGIDTKKFNSVVIKIENKASSSIATSTKNLFK